MKINRLLAWGSGLAFALLLAGGASHAQTPAPSTQQAPAQAPANKPKDQVTPLTMDSPTPPPVSAEEDAAIKTFRDSPNSDLQTKMKAADTYLTKYPQGRYRAEVYGWMVRAYLATSQISKMEQAGTKELELVPNDAQTMAILGSALPRAMSSSMTPEERERVLAEAEQDCKKALEVLPTLPKPDGMTDEAFVVAKNQTMSMAYSGLGIIAFRRGKYSDAIPSLEQSLRLDPQPDPVNYYILALSNENASHFDDAITAFTKCAAIESGLQAICKAGIEEAKKKAATQLSIPK